MACLCIPAHCLPDSPNVCASFLLAVICVQCGQRARLKETKRTKKRNGKRRLWVGMPHEGITRPWSWEWLVRLITRSGDASSSFLAIRCRCPLSLFSIHSGHVFCQFVLQRGKCIHLLLLPPACRSDKCIRGLPGALSHLALGNHGRTASAAVKSTGTRGRMTLYSDPLRYECLVHYCQSTGPFIACLSLPFFGNLPVAEGEWASEWGSRSSISMATIRPTNNKVSASRAVVGEHAPPKPLVSFLEALGTPSTSID